MIDNDPLMPEHRVSTYDFDRKTRAILKDNQTTRFLNREMKLEKEMANNSKEYSLFLKVERHFVLSYERVARDEEFARRQANVKKMIATACRDEDMITPWSGISGCDGGAGNGRAVSRRLLRTEILVRPSRKKMNI